MVEKRRGFARHLVGPIAKLLFLFVFSNNDGCVKEFETKACKGREGQNDHAISPKTGGAIDPSTRLTLEEYNIRPAARRFLDYSAIHQVTNSANKWTPSLHERK